MNTALWISQGILALAFLYSGVCKTFLSERTLVAIGQTGVVNLPAALIHFIGISELLGTVGIVLPWYTKLFPVLTPITALCFATVMVLAARIHYRLQEPKNIATNVFLFALAVFVAWGRYRAL